MKRFNLKKSGKLANLMAVFSLSFLLTAPVFLQAQKLRVSGSLLLNEQNQRFIMKGTTWYAMPFFWRNIFNGRDDSFGFKAADAVSSNWAGENIYYNSAYTNRNAQLDAMKAAGINTVRMFVGQVVANDDNNQMGGYDAYIQRMADYAESARQRGMYVIFNYYNGEWYSPGTIPEPFNYNPFTGPFVYNNYINFFQRCLAKPSIGDNPYVMFEVMNEPPDIDDQQWQDYTIRSIQTFRSLGYTGPLFFQPNKIANTYNENYVKPVLAADNNLVLCFHWYGFVEWYGRTNGFLDLCDQGIPTILGEYGIKDGGEALLIQRGNDLFDKVNSKNFIGAISFAWNTDDNEGNQMTNPSVNGLNLNNWGNIFKNSYASRLPDFFGGTVGGGGGGGTNCNWSFGASENGIVTPNGTHDVRYGANGVYAYRANVSGSIGCNNSVFGDPIPGVAKSCEICNNGAGDGGGATNCNWSFGANEDGTVTVNGTHDVRYGANGVYATITNVTGSIGCNNSVFGDPIPDVVKTCEVCNNGGARSARLAGSNAGDLKNIKDANDGKTFFNIYPNPVKGQSFNIMVKNNTATGTVNIYTVTGEKVYSAVAKNNEVLKVNGNFKPGVYFVKIIGKGINEVKKIVVQ
jgi:Cellulase (glycosyl hydrolase family 5)/Secretion system C-terminal sorting domain